ncbi:acyl-CoA dehydrogenase family protein [Mycolicibacterium madagascariense]|nr:acyl-CoA dehydrogenase family protein [Mycolicibacterium madagascariense]MCV7011692.1 acyl-CoA dehydrogenase [Mycolicibacterium madagascariense]
MVEEAVFRLFDEVATKNPGGHVAIGPPLAELGWSDIEAEYPIAACELLFRAEGRSLAHTDSLAKVILAELAPAVGTDVVGIVLPAVALGFTPSADTQQVDGIVLGPIPSTGRLVVPVAGALGTVSLEVVDAERLVGTRMDTFDSSAHWTRVGGPLDGDVVPATAEWSLAIAAAHRALATELVALADEALRIAVEHVTVRVQFGSPIGAFQSPRHLLAEAKANLEGARALLDETWRYGGEFSALIAKAAAGRAHRTVADATLQVCGAIGLTIEHDLHRYVTRGFQLDALCGSHQQIEALLAQRLIDDSSEGALPTLAGWSD